MPKAAYRSSHRDEHNGPLLDSNLGVLRPQARVCHLQVCTTVYTCSCDNLTGDVRVSNHYQRQTSVYFHIRPHHWLVGLLIFRKLQREHTHTDTQKNLRAFVLGVTNHFRDRFF